LLKKWILRRNQIAHGTEKQLDRQKLIKFLEFVRELLYELDAHRGFQWADSLLKEGLEVWQGPLEGIPGIQQVAGPIGR
jgi:hypothetical protein